MDPGRLRREFDGDGDASCAIARACNRHSAQAEALKVHVVSWEKNERKPEAKRVTVGQLWGTRGDIRR